MADTTTTSTTDTAASTTATNDKPIVRETPHTSADQRPFTGDMGQDDAFATESNPEGLRYGEKPHKPGELPPRPSHQNDDCDEPRISVGDV